MRWPETDTHEQPQPVPVFDARISRRSLSMVVAVVLWNARFSSRTRHDTSCNKGFACVGREQQHIPNAATVLFSTVRPLFSAEIDCQSQAPGNQRG